MKSNWQSKTFLDSSIHLTYTIYSSNRTLVITEICYQVTIRFIKDHWSPHVEVDFIPCQKTKMIPIARLIRYGINLNIHLSVMWPLPHIYQKFEQKRIAERDFVIKRSRKIYTFNLSRTKFYFKIVLGLGSESNHGYIDVGDGWWGPNVLVTSLRCEWPIKYIEKIRIITKKSRQHNDSTTNISNQSPS